MKLDIQKWDMERLKIEKMIKESKDRKHESGQPQWKSGNDDWGLIKFKKNATVLYTMRAALRGSNHMKEQTPEATQEALDLCTKLYLLPIALEEKVA